MSDSKQVESEEPLLSSTSDVEQNEPSVEELKTKIVELEGALNASGKLAMSTN
jgi:hypothetical protein